ncbi:hypothetical protein GOV06_03210 [Candidatus Woesearchaeota archaeon]|nr:hypothetical protein [Candidatus Woesearchaeota archaeon]
MKNILVVYKKSTFELYGSHEDTVKFIQSNDPDAEAIKKSHEIQKKSLEKVVDGLDKLDLNYNIIYRGDLTEITDKDLVISVGGDGTFLEVSHYVKDTPILGVNSDPEDSKGFYCCANTDNFIDMFDAPRTRLHRLELLLNRETIPEPVLNDVLIAHSNPGAPTLYVLDGEKHLDCGILACTAAGSSARMYQNKGILMPLDSAEIQYLVKEKRGEKPQFADKLELKSLTRQGKLYIDGPHLTYDLGLGDNLIIRKGIPLIVVGNLEEKRLI